MRIRILAAILTLACNTATISGGEYPSGESLDIRLPAGWVKFSRQPTIDEWNCVAGRPDLAVQFVDGELRIENLPARDLRGAVGLGEPATPRGERGRRTSLQVGSSWLIAIDHGEFGGSLWLVEPDGKETLLLKEPSRALFRLKKSIAVLVGPALTVEERGAILLFDASNLKAGPSRIETQGMPVVGVTTSQGDLTFTTKNGIFRLVSERRIEPLAALDRTLPFPASIADNGSFALGFGHFVLIVSNKTRTWLVPKDCPELVETRMFECECRGGGPL